MGKAKAKLRLAFMKSIIDSDHFLGGLSYSVFRDTTDYDLATVVAITRTINALKLDNYTAWVYVDGLNKTKQREYAKELRRLGIRLRKIKGVAKDENDALIRLADSLAGFVRDAIDDQEPVSKALLKRGQKRGVIEGFE